MAGPVSPAVKTLPGRYGKFLTAVVGQFLVYLQIYGWVWEPKAAATMGAIALGVLAVPNAPKTPALAPAVVPVEPLPPATGSQI